MIFFDKLKQPSYLIFRITTGFMFFCHGTQKLIGFPVEFPYKLNALTLTAGVIENYRWIISNDRFLFTIFCVYRKWDNGCSVLDDAWYK